MGKDLISGNSMSWRLGNSIRSKQVYNFGELNDGEDIIRDRERLAVGKQAAQRFERQRFNLRKLHELEVRKQYQIKITNRFAALENLNNDEDVNRT